MIAQIRKLLLSPYNQLVLFLTVMSVCAIVYTPSAFFSLAIILLSSLSLYFTFTKLFPQKKKMLASILATSLIIFLIWNPAQDLNGYLLTAFVVSIAVLLKYFAQNKGMSIFNPAALAVVIGGAIAAMPQANTLSFVSWWGAAFGGSFSLVLVAVWLILGLKKWRKHYLAFVFLATYFIIGFLVDPETAKFNLLTSTIYFVASVMLVDPKSSPVKVIDQIFYGIFTAGMFWGLELQDATYAILLMNLAFFIRTNIKFKPKTISSSST